MNRKAFWLGLVATIGAIATHTYLAMTHYEVKYGEGVGSHSICKIGEMFDCSAVAASKYSELGGVPMAVWGIVANVVALLFAFGYFFADDKSRTNARKNLLIVTGFIMATSVVMGGIAMILIGKYCLFCMIAYILSFVDFASFYVASNADRKPQSVISGARFDLKPLVISAALALIGGLIISYGWEKSYGAENLSAVVNSSVAEWAQSTPTEIIPVAPIIQGAEANKAKMTIVEFADFLCPHCRAAAPTLHAFVNAHKDVRYIFQAWPLDGECNSKISVNTGLRCGLARFAFCASKLAPEKGFAAVDWIFDHQENYRDDRSLLEPTVTEASKELGLDTQAALACVKSDEAKDAVQKEAELGQKLGMEGTPTIFVNGKKLPAGQVLPVLKETYNRLD